MKYLALDYGLKRTGVAVTDAGGRMAFPRHTLVLKTRDAFFAELVALITREEAEAIVLGLPLLLDGQETLITRQVRNFAARLARRVKLPIYWMQEILSSHEAEEDLRAAGRSGKELSAVVDQQAAVRILESFLNLPEDKRVLYA